MAKGSRSAQTGTLGPTTIGMFMEMLRVARRTLGDTVSGCHIMCLFLPGILCLWGEGDLWPGKCRKSGVGLDKARQSFVSGLDIHNSSARGRRLNQRFVFTQVFNQAQDVDLHTVNSKTQTIVDQ